MSRPKAVLWDMDGTLIDTEPLWGKATFELGELLGRPLTPEVRAKTIGGSFPNTLSVVAEWAGYELKDGDLERYRTWMFDNFVVSPWSLVRRIKPSTSQQNGLTTHILSLQKKFISVVIPPGSSATL